MRKLIVVAILLTSYTPASRAAEKSPALQAAREFASQTLQAMRGHGDDALGGPVMKHKPIVKAAPAVDMATLRSTLQDPDLDHFSISAAAFTLARASAADADVAVKALLRQMNRSMFARPHVQHHLLVALGARAVPELLRHLNDSMVLDILGDMGSEARGAVPALKEILGTRNVEAAAALVDIGTDDALAAAIPVLIRVAEDPYDPWAKHAAIALGRARKQSASAAMPALRGLLTARDPDTRLYAAAALARLGDSTAAATALGSIVRSNKMHDPHRALEALNRMGRQAAPARDDLIVFMQDADQAPEKRAAAAQTLVKIAPKDAKVRSALKSIAADPTVAKILSAEVKATAEN